MHQAMKPISLPSSLLPFQPNALHPKHHKLQSCKRLHAKVFTSRRDSYNRDHSEVDQDMIVLRMRIHDIKMVEETIQAPSNWMQYYDSDVCQVVGLLQTQLMNTRPSVVLGVMLIAALCVSTSTAMVVLQLTELVKWIIIICGDHLS